MKYKHILVTGGAGFVGSFLVDRLVEQGYIVRILDNLNPQVHLGKIPTYLNKKAEFIKGDVTDYETFEKALGEIDVVFHLAARVGVAQSNYEIKKYTDVNIGGTANLFDIVINKKLPVKKIILTSSMTSYGEGSYKCVEHGITKPSLRTKEQIAKFGWEPVCQICKKALNPIPIQEDYSIDNNSIYSLTKNVQESMLLLLGKMYEIPAVALRCFNIYGPRQSLSNPYTGVAAIFISRLKNNEQPVIFEDGLQTRDFVSVHDVVSALVLAMEKETANYQAVNIGAGTPISIKFIAKTLASIMGKNINPSITSEFRINDIRHCFADIGNAQKLLGWKPTISLEEGLKELIKWSEMEKSEDLYKKAELELKEKNLIHKQIQ